MQALSITKTAHVFLIPSPPISLCVIADIAAIITSFRRETRKIPRGRPAGRPYGNSRDSGLFGFAQAVHELLENPD
jgi:hypothetical protein